MPRIGLKALGVNLDAIKDLTIAQVFGTGILPVTECNKRFWKIIKEKNLKVRITVGDKKSPTV